MKHEDLAFLVEQHSKRSMFLGNMDREYVGRVAGKVERECKQDIRKNSATVSAYGSVTEQPSGVI